MAGEDDDRGVMAFGKVELDRCIAGEAHVPDVHGGEGPRGALRAIVIARDHPHLAGAFGKIDRGNVGA